MRNILFTVITIILNFFGYAQNIKIRGLLIDSDTKGPIEFVNIGILNKNKGTVSNQNGEFNLEVSKEFLNDSLTISHINYSPIKIPIKDTKSQRIFLEPKIIELSEVVVSNKKIKNRKIGVKSYSRLLSMRVISKANDVVEVAQKLIFQIKMFK